MTTNFRKNQMFLNKNGRGQSGTVYSFSILTVPLNEATEMLASPEPQIAVMRRRV